MCPQILFIYLFILSKQIFREMCTDFIHANHTHTHDKIILQLLKQTLHVCNYARMTREWVVSCDSTYGRMCVFTKS